MFVVLELQKSDSLATITTTHETREEAEQKYHTVLSFASVSGVPLHSAVMLTEEGYYIKSESYKHDVKREEKLEKTKAEEPKKELDEAVEEPKEELTKAVEDTAEEEVEESEVE